MKECLTGRMSMRKASRQFGIPLGTLQNKCKDRHSKKVGTSLRLSNETETHLVTSINTLSHCKIPLTSIDIKLLVKDYLDRSSVHDSRFKNNVPGNDWFKSFIKQNNLTQRLAGNVKPACVKNSVPRSPCSTATSIEKR